MMREATGRSSKARACWLTELYCSSPWEPARPLPFNAAAHWCPTRAHRTRADRSATGRVLSRAPGRMQTRAVPTARRQATPARGARVGQDQPMPVRRTPRSATRRARPPRARTPAARAVRASIRKALQAPARSFGRVPVRPGDAGPRARKVCALDRSSPTTSRRILARRA